jgi:hypothetical protein
MLEASAAECPRQASVAAGGLVGLVPWALRIHFPRLALYLHSLWRLTNWGEGRSDILQARDASKCCGIHSRQARFRRTPGIRNNCMNPEHTTSGRHCSSSQRVGLCPSMPQANRPSNSVCFSRFSPLTWTALVLVAPCKSCANGTCGTHFSRHRKFRLGRTIMALRRRQKILASRHLAALCLKSGQRY